MFETDEKQHKSPYRNEKRYIGYYSVDDFDGDDESDAENTATSLKL